MSPETISIRDFRAEDFPFIISSWGKSYKMMSYFAKRIDHNTFFENHPKVISGVLELPQMRILMATDASDPDQILGYLVGSCLRFSNEDKQSVILQYIFVKKEFQRLGIAKQLLAQLDIKEGDEVQFTHWTYPMDEISKKYPTWVYNPYLI
jgi:GNAT superfamily N-acetyltransferase